MTILLDNKPLPRFDMTPSRKTNRSAYAAGPSPAVSSSVPPTPPSVGYAPASQSPGPFPRLEGQLVTDASTRARAADDRGHIVHHEPRAVVQPRSSEDIARVVSYANDEGLQVAVRGGAHTVLGQTQARGGIVVDSATLSRAHRVSTDTIVVDAGVRWLDVIIQAHAKHAVPPVVPDYLDHTIGGFIASGGLTGRVHRKGLAADNVVELEVVTGDGERVICSPVRDVDLFESVVGGFGLCALIARATLRLGPWRDAVRTFSLTFETLGDLLALHGRLACDERFDYLRGTIVTAPERNWCYQLQCSVFYDRHAPPRNDRILAGLSDQALWIDAHDKSFKAWLLRMSGTIEYLKRASLWSVPHPRLDLMLPGPAARDFIARMLAELDPEETAGVPISVIACRAASTQVPLFVMKDVEVWYALTVPLFAFPGAMSVSSLLARNLALCDLARECGGRPLGFATDPIPCDGEVASLREPESRKLLNRKRAYDPNAILTPGYYANVVNERGSDHVGRCNVSISRKSAPDPEPPGTQIGTFRF